MANTSRSHPISFHDRLRMVREEVLKISQEQMAAVGGVKRNAQANYERGTRRPDAEYLMALAEHEIDVLYLLTGQHTPTVGAQVENHPTVGSRLRMERKKRGKSQSQWASLLGVSKETQINYEKNVSSPNAEYLARADTLGVDVLYVVTGRREVDRPPMEDDERR